ncbi:MAG: intermembrane transport protein PqiB [Steroidobacteraceae bacterium]
MYSPPHVEAPLRVHSWLSWVWLVPIIAAAAVLWLAWRGLAARGPEITIAFADAGTLEPGQTPIKYKGVSVGMVRSIGLSRDVSHVLVRARMKRSIEPYLATGARFWIVQPRVGAQGISGLTTLVSGAYIEMYPGRGAAQRHFKGLTEPPVLQPDTAGTLFTLFAPDVSALIPGAPITFRGIDVGEVEGFALAPSDREVRIYGFVHAPYDRLVHSQTRFWNVAAINLSVGSQGVAVRVSSWQQLLAGGVAFDTPAAGRSSPQSTRGSRFRLYDSRAEAFRYPHGKPLVYQARFAADARGLGKGTPVELQGTDIGEVTHARLRYDRRHGSLYTLATIAIDPSVVDFAGVAQSSTAGQAAAMQAALRNLVAHGLRAQLVSSSLITGSKLVALDRVSGAPPARIHDVAGVPQLPAAPSLDIDAILRSVQHTVDHIDRATAGPQLRHAVTELDATLTQLHAATTTLTPEAQSLVKSLRATSAAAQRTADTMDALLGANGGASTDLPRLMRQLSEAASSIRELASYLDRHPEALLRGRRH